MLNVNIQICAKSDSTSYRGHRRVQKSAIIIADEQVSRERGRQKVKAEEDECECHNASRDMSYAIIQ